MVLTLPERLRFDPPIIPDEFKGITLISFGYHYSPITVADLLVDLRGVMDATPFTAWWTDGTNWTVKDKISEKYGKLVVLYTEVIKEMAYRKRPLTVAFGCERGIHRSVGVVELINGMVAGFYPTKVIHRDLRRADN